MEVETKLKKISSSDNKNRSTQQQQKKTQVKFGYCSLVCFFFPFQAHISPVRPVRRGGFSGDDHKIVYQNHKNQINLNTLSRHTVPAPCFGCLSTFLFSNSPSVAVLAKLLCCPITAQQRKVHARKGSIFSCALESFASFAKGTRFSSNRKASEASRFSCTVTHWHYSILPRDRRDGMVQIALERKAGTRFISPSNLCM